MTKRSLLTLFAVGWICNVVLAANPPPLTTCIKDMSLVYRNEKLVTDTSIRRVYILCPNTVFSPGIANPKTGVISGGQEALACRSNCLVKCGNNGKSENKCIIDGTGTYGIFQVPYNVFTDLPLDSSNVVFQGITIDFFVSAGQIPVLAASFSGSVTFRDCRWTNNSADPAFIISDLQFAPALARNAIVDAPPRTAPGFVWKIAASDSNRKRNLIDKDFEVGDSPIVNDDSNASKRSRRQLRAADISQDEGTEVATDGNRILQTTGSFKVTFENCLFEFNDAVRNAKNTGGLSLIRFMGLTVYPEGVLKERLGSIDGSIIRSQFKGNVFNFNNDMAVYRSIIDFYSSGRLVMDTNCFKKSPVKKYGVITVQKGAKITNVDNFVDKEQPSLKCDFIALLNTDYDAMGCGKRWTATRCLLDFCFPGDATCQVQGQGTVLMRNVKLGDKILVQGGKYEPVYSFGHHSEHAEHRYLKSVAPGRTLEISKDHLVFVEGGRVVPASSVKVGDKLQLADGELASVEAIEDSRKLGAYAPFTASGKVVVNGVVASSFTSLQGSENLKIGSIDTGLSYHFLACAFEMPHRMWCQYASACREETYTPDGISIWVALPHMFAKWYLKQHAVIMGLLGVPLVGILLCMAHPVTALMALIAVLLGIRHHGIQCKSL